MKPETEIILRDLKTLEWFHAIGQPIHGDVTTAATWSDAVKHLSGHQWQKIKLEWRNELTLWLHLHHCARFQQWNELVTALNPHFMPIVERNVDRAVADETLRKAVRDAANWDILHLLMEAEYSDLREPKYYAALGLVYLDGHLPCGWDSKHSGGRIIVY